MRRFALLLLFGVFLSPAFSQNIQKAFSYLEQGKYTKALKLFEKLSRSSYRTDLIMANYGLAKLYADTAFDNHDTQLAYSYLQNTERYYLRANNAVKRYLEQTYGFNYQSISRLRDTLLNPLMHQVLQSRDIRKINDFIYTYDGTPQALKVRFFIDSLDFAAAAKQNTVDAWRKFLSEHKNSALTAKAKKILDSLWKIEFDKAYKSLELSSIERFERKYPDYPYNPDTVLFYKDLAVRARSLKLYTPLDSTIIDTYVRFLKDAAPYEPAYLTLLKLAEPQLLKKNWKAAADTIEKYKNLFPGDNRLDSLLAILLRKDRPLNVQPLPGEANTPGGSEFLPVITADDSTIYFCGEDRADNLGKEDIYVTRKQGDKWTKAAVLEDLSTAYGNEAPMSITPDGNTMIIFKNGDIFLSHKTATGWSEPEPIKEINSGFWDADAFITADGNAIIFTSDRPNPSGDYHPFNSYYHGGFTGNTDLWVVVRQGDHWSDPINLGQVINTPFAERGPFLHPDMKTLYFLSDGHTTLGSLDVLVSRRLSDTSWTQWSEPVNLGKLINTPLKEFRYVISASGDLAYYSLYNNGQYDIYIVEMPGKLRPGTVVRVFGYVMSTEGKPLAAKIVWEDLEENRTLGQLQTDPSDGYYVITLPLGKNYGFYVSADGYYPLSGNLDLSQKQVKKDYRKDFVLISVEQIISDEKPVVLNNIFFDFNSAKLRPESYPELRRFAEFVKQNPNLVFEISGHTDSIGSEQYNKKLSYERAKAVRDYLISLGCNPEQLRIAGYGYSKPIASNKTEEGRSKNRRVEFRVIDRLYEGKP